MGFVTVEITEIHLGSFKQLESKISAVYVPFIVLLSQTRWWKRAEKAVPLGPGEEDFQFRGYPPKSFYFSGPGLYDEDQKRKYIWNDKAP